jgi:hypothetical protein
MVERATHEAIEVPLEEVVSTLQQRTQAAK